MNTSSSATPASDPPPNETLAAKGSAVKETGAETIAPTTLEILFDVSQQLKQSLEPVEPSTRFRAELRRKLSENVGQLRDVIQTGRQRRNRLRIGAIALGILVFGSGLLALAIRLTRILTGRVARKAKATRPAKDS